MSTRSFFSMLAFLMALATMPMHILAEEVGTRDEAKTMVEAAVAHVKKVGPDQAFKDFQNDKANWFKKNLYVFAYNMQGVCMVFGANEKIIGKNLFDLKDPNGKFVVRDMIGLVSTKGAGWVEYEYVDPVTKKFATKESFVQKTPNFDGFVGVGVYKP